LEKTPRYRPKHVHHDFQKQGELRPVQRENLRSADCAARGKKGNVDDSEKRGDQQFAIGQGTAVGVRPEQNVEGADDRGQYGQRHQPDQTDAQELKRREIGSEALLIGQRQNKAAQAKEEIDGKVAVGRQRRHVHPVADMKKDDRESGEASQTIKRRVVISLFHLPTQNLAHPEIPTDGTALQATSLLTTASRVRRDLNIQIAATPDKSIA
jgi:hypothetical protein